MAKGPLLPQGLDSVYFHWNDKGDEDLGAKRIHWALWWLRESAGGRKGAEFKRRCTDPYQPSIYKRSRSPDSLSNQLRHTPDTPNTPDTPPTNFLLNFGSRHFKYTYNNMSTATSAQKLYSSPSYNNRTDHFTGMVKDWWTEYRGEVGICLITISKKSEALVMRSRTTPHGFQRNQKMLNRSWNCVKILRKVWVHRNTMLYQEPATDQYPKTLFGRFVIST